MSFTEFNIFSKKTKVKKKRKQKSHKFTEFVLIGWDTFDKKHKYSARLLVGNIGLGTVLTS